MKVFSDSNGHVQMVCGHCREAFTSYPSHAGKRKYCSSQCYWQARRDKQLARFWSRVQRGDGCWLWRGSIGTNGYGVEMDGSHRRLVHRLMYERSYGAIPDGLFVCHRCDNPICVRPDHLFLGTHDDNMADMVAKGRQTQGDRHPVHLNPERQRGERNGNARLTKAQVEELRKLYATGKYLQKELARMFGIGRSNMSAILRGETWTI